MHYMAISSEQIAAIHSQIDEKLAKYYNKDEKGECKLWMSSYLQLS
jgi:hypothetical protein